MILQWTPRQVHDTVAAIASQPAFNGSRRQSLLGRLLRFIIERIGELLSWFRGSLDARVIVIAAIVVVAGVVIARIYADRRAVELRRRGTGSRGTRVERADPWHVARELAAADRFTEACHALYAAVLDSLARSALVRLHASKTAGDYARELRRSRAPMAAEFRAFGRDFEHVVFGNDAATRDDYERLLAAAERVGHAGRQRPAA